jgi:hypothetical protein
MSAMLPEEFAEWEQFAPGWCLPSEDERYDKRLASSMQEIQALYDATTARAAEAIEYCNRFPLDAMPDEAVNLMRLLYAMMTVSFAVECWGQARVPDSGAAMLDCLVEPRP